MKEFGEKFYTNVMRLVDKNHAEKSLLDGLSEEDAELVKEVLEHAYFAQECSEKFHGRNDLMDEV